MLVQPAHSQEFGPVTARIEDGETAFEAVLRVLEDACLEFAESDLTLIADAVPLPAAPDLTTSTALYLLRAAPPDPMLPMMTYRALRWLRPFEVPAALSLDCHRETWKLIRSHQLSSA
jgi:hypothetical protein